MVRKTGSSGKAIFSTAPKTAGDSSGKMAFVLMLLTSLIVGMSSFFFNYPYFYWLGQSFTSIFLLAISLPRNIGFFIACICLVKYYKLMTFRRGVLTALGIIIGTFAFFIFGLGF